MRRRRAPDGNDPRSCSSSRGFALKCSSGPALQHQVRRDGTARADGRIGAPEDEGGDGRFLISHRSEEQLEKKYRRDALVLGLAAAGLFLFGLIFVAVGALVDVG